MTISRWMISIEGHVVCEGVQPTFESGVAALFSVFYNFNLKYQDGASGTLEFIQRYVKKERKEKRGEKRHTVIRAQLCGGND